ncbi:MAG: MBL fold metallo-hydrolase [Nitrososphaeria archaeon]|nr:MBL fold metallo-hydrolase [Conexivisphaerales archaeon]
MAERVYAIYRIPIKEVSGNAYLVVRGKEAAVVDTGLPGYSDQILKSADSLDAKVSHIILTHYHIDHTGSLKDLKEKTGAKVFIHEKDAPYLSGKEKFPLPSTVPQEVIKLYSTYRHVEPDAILKDDDRVFGFRVIHVPGHTPGSIVLYDGRALFAGDNMNSREGKIEGSPAMFDWDRELAKKSVKKLLDLDFEMLMPGHGEPVLEKASELARNSIRL